MFFQMLSHGVTADRQYFGSSPRKIAPLQSDLAGPAIHEEARLDRRQQTAIMSGVLRQSSPVF
jgi:hypothetical protein